MSGLIRTRFHEIAAEKGWLLKDIQGRWGLSERQMSRIARNPSVRDLDAISGLPNKGEQSANLGVVPSTSWLTSSTLDKLNQGAKLNNLSTEAYLQFLLNDDLERWRLLSFCQNQVIDPNMPAVHEITQVINEELNLLEPTSEVDEFREALEQLYERLLREKRINTKANPNRIGESQRLKIPRVAYYWYGGTLAKACGRWFHTENVYLWDELFHTDSEVLFVGSPENVVVSYQVCYRLCQLFKKSKSLYKKQAGSWGSKQDVEDEANDYISMFARGVNEADCGWLDEDDYGVLFDYIEKHYRYTLR